MKRIAAVAIGYFGFCLTVFAETAAQKAALNSIDPLFEKFAADQHIPGMVYGAMLDGQLVYLRTFGVQDVKTRAPVTPLTLFRIASMSKNFTALALLNLRDEGKLSFDMPAERYIPELAKLEYPTSDSPKITVRDLLAHSAGFVTDDPWGDRQLDMSAENFSRFVAAGVPFSRPPGVAFEYSNFGYAVLGRIITNVAARNYADYIADAILKPLRMNSTSYDIAKTPTARRALGYRWENDAWVEEPVLGHGEFGAMGGLITNASDYARYVGWILAAWPPRDGADDATLKRASVRDMARPQTYASIAPPTDPSGSARAGNYGFGVIVYNDCILGFHFGHSGGLPGYGSNVLFLPDRGLGLFAFANRTYAPVARVVRDAAVQLVKSDSFPARALPTSEGLKAMAIAVERIYAAGDVLAAHDALAMNVLLDRSAALRNNQLRELKGQLGACRAADPIRADTAMSATLTFPCANGTLRARIILAPTTPPSMQTLEFSR